MKRFIAVLFVLQNLFSSLSAQSEAGAIFLLIAPGARAGGMGEAQVAVANDAYASYWNPAGLGFLKGSDAALMHVNWLPNLADDLYYEFLAFKQPIGYGTVGGHLIYLNLGEQQGMDEFGNATETFKSMMWAASASYGAKLTSTSSIGLNLNITPSSSSNKILLLFSATIDTEASGRQGDITIWREISSSNVAINGNGFMQIYNSAGRNVSSGTFNYYDSPSTTNQILYRIALRSNTGTQLNVGANTGGNVTLTAIEVDA